MLSNSEKLEKYFSTNRTPIEEDIKKLTEMIDRNEINTESYEQLHNAATVKMKNLKDKITKDWEELEKAWFFKDEANIKWWNKIIEITKVMEKTLETIEKPIKKTESNLASDSKSNSLDKQGKKNHQITSWPRSGLKDIPLTIDEIKKITTEKMIAEHWSIKYYIINWLSEKYVFRIDESNDEEEVAWLKISSSDDDEKIIEKIEIAETTPLWDNKFQDIEMEWYNAISSSWQTIVDWVSSVSGVLSWIGTWVGLAVPWAWAAVLTSGGIAWVKALWWTIAWASLAAKSIAFWKIVIAWATATWPLLVWLGTAWVLWAFTDVDFTTKKAKDLKLFEKIQTLKN